MAGRLAIDRVEEEEWTEVVVAVEVSEEEIPLEEVEEAHPLEVEEHQDLTVMMIEEESARELHRDTTGTEMIIIMAQVMAVDQGATE